VTLQAHQKAADYTLAKGRFGVFSMAFGSLMLLEAWLLAGLAILLGVALALAALMLTSHWLAQARSFVLAPLDWPAETGWALATAFAVATLAALLPAWRAARMPIHDALAQG
jgi:ABC-type antimicrobial peptide transport system permease subunit